MEKKTLSWYLGAAVMVVGMAVALILAIGAALQVREASEPTVVTLYELKPEGDHNLLITVLDGTKEVPIILNSDFVEVKGWTKAGDTVHFTECIRSFKGQDPIGYKGKLILPKRGENPIVRIELLPDWDKK
ncbi:MAG: hypothetical protein ACOZBZ_02925 [Patescibacteria group bacterium]